VINAISGSTSLSHLDEPEPAPAPSAGPTHVADPATPQQTPPGEGESPTWSKPDASKVDAYINQAMAQSHGDVSQAFSYLRDLRDKPQNYYDSNLAIAADYMRARWDTQQHGPGAETEDIAAYLAAKRAVGVPQEGPGPVSPYSDLEKQYMLKGVADEVKSDPKVLAWEIPLGPVPVSAGTVKNIVDQVRSWF
jgi:hypothetical protein